MKDIPIWYDLLVISFLLSATIAYPIVALFVTRPIQRKLRQTNQDYLSQWVIPPFQSIFYAGAVLIPMTRWRHENNKHMVDTDELVRKAATPLQWWLSLWWFASTCTMVLLIFLPPLLKFLGLWSLDGG
ncbi:hypothetical protein [Rheinheimera pleomorphica]|uniref:hypothetical protein n=1 Tax=Rheinheimera pleomorphica TaxID=2703963 RepID=UPI00141FCC72|nr:hypothetical protein [Rheinheimera pleomorphica]